MVSNFLKSDKLYLHPGKHQTGYPSESGSSKIYLKICQLKRKPRIVSGSQELIGSVPICSTQKIKGLQTIRFAALFSFGYFLVQILHPCKRTSYTIHI